MHVFDTHAAWPSSNKVNFVDNADVFVGFDTDQCCCEDADWYITDRLDDITPLLWERSAEGVEITARQNSEDFDLEDYYFDTEYVAVESAAQYVDAGRAIRFRLTANGKADLYLILFNCHNGYYSHGFTIKSPNQDIIEDYL